MSTALQELKDKKTAKLKYSHNIWQQATQGDGSIDLSKSEALRNLPDDDARQLKLKEIEDELTDLTTQITVWEANAAQQRRMEQMYQENQEIPPEHAHVHDGRPNGSNGLVLASKDAGLSLGELCARDWAKGPGRRDTWLSKDYADFEVKAILTTATSYAPEVTRIPRVAEYVARPIEVVDMFPVGATGQQAVAYMEETSRTNNAAEVAEGGLMPQSDFAFTEKTVLVKKIATYMTVNTVAA